MAVSAVTDPLAGARPKARREVRPTSPSRLWPALLARWTERLDRRIDADLGGSTTRARRRIAGGCPRS